MSSAFPRLKNFMKYFHRNVPRRWLYCDRTPQYNVTFFHMKHQNNSETASIPEDGLIRRAQEGDTFALAEIVNEYEEKVYNFALKMLKNREDAEDVLQETFLSVVKAIKSFKGQSKLSTWIYKIATNAALMKLRSRKRIFESLDEDTVNLSRDYEAFDRSVSQSPYEIVKNKDIIEKINNHLDGLPPKQRTVFVLRDMENFSTREVAGMLDMPLPSVKTNLMRARIRLRDKLADAMIS